MIRNLNGRKRYAPNLYWDEKHDGVIYQDADEEFLIANYNWMVPGGIFGSSRYVNKKRFIDLAAPGLGCGTGDF